MFNRSNYWHCKEEFLSSKARVKKRRIGYKKPRHEKKMKQSWWGGREALWFIEG